MLLLTVWIISVPLAAENIPEKRHRIKPAFEFNVYTDFTSYTSIHTGLSMQYTYRIADFSISDNSGLQVHAGLGTGVLLEGGSRFPEQLKIQSGPVYIPILPLLSLEYRYRIFILELTVAAGGEMVLYKNSHPYIQGLLKTQLDTALNVTDDLALGIGIGWSMMGVLDYWSGLSMSVGTRFSL